MTEDWDDAFKERFPSTQLRIKERQKTLQEEKETNYDNNDVQGDSQGDSQGLGGRGGFGVGGGGGAGWVVVGPPGRALWQGKGATPPVVHFFGSAPSPAH